MKRIDKQTRLTAASRHALVVYGRGHYNVKLSASVVAELRPLISGSAWARAKQPR